MVQYKTEAIVLRLRKYREADALATLITLERGKVNAVAKGVYMPSSKLRGGVQPYSVNEMMLVSGRSSLHTLIQSECAEMLLPLRQSYTSMAYGAYWAELLENFSQEELADEELYQLAKAGFLGLAIAPGYLMGRALEVRLIGQQGLRPDFSLCCHCGGSYGNGVSDWFSSAEGGFLCDACAKRTMDCIKTSPAVPGLWQGLENLALDKIGRLTVTKGQMEELGKVLNLWIVRHTGRPMKTWPMIKELEG